MAISFFFVGNYHSVEDYDIATNLAEGNGYVLSPEIGPTALKVPIYPLVLSTFIFIFDDFAKLSIVLFQHLLMIISAWLIIKIGENLNYVREAKIMALIFVFYPAYIYYPNIIEVTNLFIFETFVYIYFAVKFKTIKDNRYLIALSLVSGLIFLTQPVVVPLIIISWFFLLKKDYKKIIIPIFITLIIQSPWIIRNFNEFGKIIPFKSPFWMNFYVGYVDDNIGSKFDIISEGDKNRIDSLKQTKNDVDMEPYYKEIVIKAITDDPLNYLEKTFYQIFKYWWVPERYFNNNDIRFLIVRKIPLLLINFLTIVALIYLYKENPKLILGILFVLMYFTLIYGLTQSLNIRFKLDIEWLQFVPISLFIKRKFDRFIF